MLRGRGLLCFLLVSAIAIPGWTTRSTFDADSPCHAQLGRGKRALITGITGMLGSHLAAELVRREFRVSGFVRPRSNVRAIGHILDRVTLVHGELMDPWRTLRVMQEVKPDYVFHLAAQAFNSLSFGDPEYTLDANTKMTLNILEAARRLEPGPRVLIAGSSTVYGATTEEWDGPIPESARLQPVSPYGVSKVTQEMLALQYGRTYGLHVVVPRFFIHVASNGVEVLALHEFARQVAMIERGLQEPVLLHGDISTERDITDADDSAGVVVCLAETAPSGTVVNVGSGMRYTMRDILATIVNSSTARDRIQLQLDEGRRRPYDEKVVMADNSRLRQLTGWQPRPDMRRLIASLLNYWRQEVAFRHIPEGAGVAARTNGTLGTLEL